MQRTPIAVLAGAAVRLPPQRFRSLRRVALSRSSERARRGMMDRTGVYTSGYGGAQGEDGICRMDLEQEEDVHVGSRHVLATHGTKGESKQTRKPGPASLRKEVGRGTKRRGGGHACPEHMRFTGAIRLVRYI